MGGISCVGYNNAPDKDNPVAHMDIARVRIRQTLMSREQIRREAQEWLSEAEKSKVNGISSGK